jgi:hypothetical protein
MRVEHIRAQRVCYGLSALRRGNHNLIIRDHTGHLCRVCPVPIRDPQSGRSILVRLLLGTCILSRVSLSLIPDELLISCQKDAVPRTEENVIMGCIAALRLTCGGLDAVPDLERAAMDSSLCHHFFVLCTWRLSLRFNVRGKAYQQIRTRTKGHFGFVLGSQRRFGRRDPKPVRSARNW